MLVSQTLPHDVAFLVCVPLRAASLAMLSAGSSVLAHSAGVAVSITINLVEHIKISIAFLIIYTFEFIIAISVKYYLDITKL